jgi:tetratricopeptide (TPR) repeat protein
MRKLLLLACSAFVLELPAYAAEVELKIDLPDAKLMLPPVSPPQLQKEGLPLPLENDLVNEVLAFVARRDFEGALGRIREREGELLALLESGDPEGQIQLSVVPGGFNPERRGMSVSATLLYMIGHVYLSLERYAPAEIAFQNALVPLPDYLRVHESLGLLYLTTERYEEARVHLVRAAELGLNTANLHAALGYLNQETQNYWGAASAFEQALALDNGNESWQRGLLFALIQSRQYGSAMTLIEQMLQGNADDRDLWLYRSQAALSTGERDLALSSLETAIRLGDDSAANRQVCATLHMELGSIARAVELLKGGDADDMEFPFVYQALQWLERKGEWDYMQDLLVSLDARRAALTETEQSQLLAREAALRLHANDRQAARTALQRSVDLDPSNADALMALGQLYREARDYDRAELLFQRASAYDLYRENALVYMAQLAIDQENFARALELLRDVVSRNPARVDLRRNVETLENLVLLETDD